MSGRLPLGVAARGEQTVVRKCDVALLASVDRVHAAELSRIAEHVQLLTLRTVAFRIRIEVALFHAVVIDDCQRAAIHRASDAGGPMKAIQSPRRR